MRNLPMVLVIALLLAGCSAQSVLEDNAAFKQAGQVSFESHPVLCPEEANCKSAGQRYRYTSGKDVSDISLNATLACEGGKLTTITLGASGVVASKAKQAVAAQTVAITELLASRDAALAQSLAPAVAEVLKGALTAATGIPVP